MSLATKFWVVYVSLVTVSGIGLKITDDRSWVFTGSGMVLGGALVALYEIHLHLRRNRNVPPPG